MVSYSRIEAIGKFCIALCLFSLTKLLPADEFIDNQLKIESPSFTPEI